MPSSSPFRARMVELAASVEKTPGQYRLGEGMDRVGLFPNRLRVGVLWFVHGDDPALAAHVVLGSAHPDNPTILDVREVEASCDVANARCTWAEANIPTDPGWKELGAPTELRKLRIHERGGSARLEVPDIRSMRDLAEADRTLAAGAVLLRVSAGMEFAGLVASEQMPFNE